jgi:hypothetical protein
LKTLYSLSLTWASISDKRRQNDGTRDTEAM